MIGDARLLKGEKRTAFVHLSHALVPWLATHGPRSEHTASTPLRRARADLSHGHDLCGLVYASAAIHVRPPSRILGWHRRRRAPRERKRAADRGLHLLGPAIARFARAIWCQCEPCAARTGTHRRRFDQRTGRREAATSDGARNFPGPVQ